MVINISESVNNLGEPYISHSSLRNGKNVIEVVIVIGEWGASNPI